MKKILVYGDSNSWGYVPSLGTRYSREIRWPGVASSILGGDYEIIENAISGRTTIYEDPGTPKRNGYDGLGYALAESYPLDLVILFLGTNDLKFTDSEGYRRGITSLIHLIMNAQNELKLEHPIFSDSEKILVVGPPFINSKISSCRPNHSLSNAAAESQKLSRIAKEVADAEGTEYVDVSALVYPGVPDCLHLDPESHSIIGQALAAKILSIFSRQ